MICVAGEFVCQGWEQRPGSHQGVKSHADLPFHSKRGKEQLFQTGIVSSAGLNCVVNDGTQATDKQFKPALGLPSAQKRQPSWL